ncbi:hypothetical protein K8O68_02110 [Salipaludibacillus sp. CUR1]|uniref:hypothetical protein n=1 Tax=Salipaludibacillus sp. CUR1 TaxID=2820003 RepID=UPI001E3CD814|nr:hypothetical protein [Salipaludibacillus sp. CUR1]MCE7791212.1 hypothetical protein [Salipaludibacillus sp. CUR1]
MAFGVTRQELVKWKTKAANGQIAFLTHFWYDPRFPQYKTVTKAACTHKETLIQWGRKYGLKEEWIHDRQTFPHFDLMGEWEKRILREEGRESKLVQLEQKLCSGNQQRTTN